MIRQIMSSSIISLILPSVKSSFGRRVVGRMYRNRFTSNERLAFATDLNGTRCVVLWRKMAAELVNWKPFRIQLALPMFRRMWSVCNRNAMVKSSIVNSHAYTHCTIELNLINYKHSRALSMPNSYRPQRMCFVRYKQPFHWWPLHGWFFMRTYRFICLPAISRAGFTINQDPMFN